MPQIEQSNNIDIRVLHQEEMSDMIGNPPSWLLKSGMTMVAIVVFCIIALSAVIQYPDNISGEGILTSSTPPIELVARSNGYLDRVMITDGQKVNKGDDLFLINNTTNPNEINALSLWIEEYKAIKDPRRYLNIDFPNNLQLGSIQDNYSRLQLTWEELIQNLKNGVVFQQIGQIEEEIKKIVILNQSQERETVLYAQELGLQEAEFYRQQTLLEDGIVSQQDLENSKTNLLQKERQHEGMEKGIIQNNIQIEQLRLSQLQLQSERADLIRNYQFTINQIIAQIKSGVATWAQLYTITAPIDGLVHFQDRIKEKISLESGDQVGYVIPKDSEEKYLSSIIPIYNVGKVKEGQRVIIKFPSYPYKEYGVVESQVSSVSYLPIEIGEGQLGYEIVVALEDTIYSDIGISIPYRPKMTGDIEIITDDASILERILDEFLSLVKNIDI